MIFFYSYKMNLQSAHLHKAATNETKILQTQIQIKNSTFLTSKSLPVTLV